jgi:hypothetical protein
MFFEASEVDKIEIHETLWTLLLNTFENLEELKDLILQTDKNGNNYVQHLIISDKPGIIEFTIQKFKKVFSIDQYEEILNSIGESNEKFIAILSKK